MVLEPMTEVPSFEGLYLFDLILVSVRNLSKSNQEGRLATCKKVKSGVGREVIRKK